MKMTDNAKAALEKLVAEFGSKAFPSVMAKAMIKGDKPSSKWSVLNRAIMHMNGTADARGYKQWWKAGRYVTRGSKAFHILAPVLVTREREGKNGKVEEYKVVVGFRAIPVFRYEDTAGDKLESYSPSKPLPLAEVAEKWGLTVSYEEGDGKTWGSYNHVTDEIKLHAKDDPLTWLHELSHAAHHKVEGLQRGQNVRDELVAELSAATLAVMHGVHEEGASQRYMAAYAQAKDLMDLEQACMGVMAVTEKVICKILEVKA